MHKRIRFNKTRLAVLNRLLLITTALFLLAGVLLLMSPVAEHKLVESIAVAPRQINTDELAFNHDYKQWRSELGNPFAYYQPPIPKPVVPVRPPPPPKPVIVPPKPKPMPKPKPVMNTNGLSLVGTAPGERIPAAIIFDGQSQKSHVVFQGQVFRNGTLETIARDSVTFVVNSDEEIENRARAQLPLQERFKKIDINPNSQP